MLALLLLNSPVNEPWNWVFRVNWDKIRVSVSHRQQTEIHFFKKQKDPILVEKPARSLHSRVFCLPPPHAFWISVSLMNSFPLASPLQTLVLMRHAVNARSSSLETLSFFLTLLAPAVTPLFVLSERWIHMPCGCFINCKRDSRQQPSGRRWWYSIKCIIFYPKHPLRRFF